MSDLVIKVENISKQYRLGQVSTGTLNHDINRWWHKLRGKEDPYLKIGDSNDRTAKGGSDYVWALRDINFEVQQGEVLGIIGRNGAGKSTLLKILSRTTAPTIGNIKIKGRVASLLEVGTGFHPELSGRENIFLNGAILGMTRKEIERKFDEIVDFAGIERYVDTPVKRYSSGMYVRLAFAVAAHLEPEILIVDEVLAVGDSEFQKKCLGKMKDVSEREGRTVLFVSHNMAAVKQLCTKGVVLRNGELVFSGTQYEAVNNYQNASQTNSSFLHYGDISNAPGNENIRILSFNILPLKADVITISNGIYFEIEFVNYKANTNVDVTFELKTIDEIIVFHNGALISTKQDSKLGKYKVKGELPPNFLNAGTYYFNLIFGENQRYPLHIERDFVQFEVMNESVGTNSHPSPGVVRPAITYQISFE
ncbi:ABC transporter ATP-binding protein [Lacibacter sp. H407]|uniref:ABC transporter ATP-binding protein n=1 Tax=Lacibacter sp. H407 TaxID=3133423 RepID=UPI0030BCDD68